MNESLLHNAVRLHETGDLAGAARLYAEILRANPRHFQALYMLAFAHLQGGHFEDAERLMGDAARLNPQSPDAYFMRGSALQRLGRLQEAIGCYDHALSLRPNFVDALLERGTALMAMRRFEQALLTVDTALALSPKLAGGWNNRGYILQHINRGEEAIVCFEKALALEPNFPEALLSYGAALFEAKRFEDAVAAYEKTLALVPDTSYLRGNLLLYRLHCCDWRHYREDCNAVSESLKAGKSAILPFPFITVSHSVEEQLRCARIWAERECPKAPALWRGERYRHDKIRVAYVSADFHAHATAHLMAGVFEHHDRSRFEINAISLGPEDSGELRTRLLSSFDRFIDVRRNSDTEAAAIVRQLETDIAVDLKGYTLNHRAGIFAYRPAPIQASYLGYPGTMGADFIDYLIADRIVVPEEHQLHYTEKLVYLPGSYQCNDAKRRISEKTPSRAEAGLPETGFVFCCFNNNYKIAPDVFDIWMRLLRTIDGSVLWLLEDNQAAARGLRREAQARGIAPERLVFASRMPSPEHLARHRLADVFLDTLPYGAHTTASDALWAGLPVLTCKGQTFAGRVAASLLNAVGMPETAFDSLEDYEKAAMHLARDKEALAGLKAKLLHNRATHPLFDTARFTRHLETAFMIMSERQQKGEKPASFSVEASVR